MCIYNHDICFNIKSKINSNDKNIGIGFLVFKEKNGKLTITFGHEHNNYI